MESYEGGSKNSMAKSLGIGGGTENSMAGSPEKKSCNICLSSGTCRYHSPEPNQQLSVYSSVCEDVGKQKQQLHTEGHQMGNTFKRVDEKQEARIQEQDTTLDQFIPSSSLCYGGPEEYYGSLDGRNKETDKEGRKLKEPDDPFSLEYATRGNWWKGKVPSTTKILKGLIPAFIHRFQAMLDSAWNMISMYLCFKYVREGKLYTTKSFST
ncbi:hypothetical protein SUGI_1140260 [Cryptomeria japonica]|nr:hypothetical protein SUGI_1140260 [Cryptomeria japonica]